MQTAGCLTVEVDLTFPTAAVGFTVNIGPERTAEGVPLRIRPRALVEGKTARFSRKRRILWQTLWGASVVGWARSASRQCIQRKRLRHISSRNILCCKCSPPCRNSVKCWRISLGPIRIPSWCESWDTHS